jgi:hypothetical protein
VSNDVIAADGVFLDFLFFSIIYPVLKNNALQKTGEKPVQKNSPGSLSQTIFHCKPASA